MKRCPCCDKKKETTEFYKRKCEKDGLDNYCKDCRFLKNHTVEQVLCQRYCDLRSRALGHPSKHGSTAQGKPFLTKLSWKRWCNKHQRTFTRMYRIWQANGFDYMLSPTIDRIDNNIGYMPSNMRWATLSENSKKGRK